MWLNACYEYQCDTAAMSSLNSLQWRHNGRDSVSNHQLQDCLFNRLFRQGSKETSKLRVTGLCEGNSPGTGEFPAQRASNVENISIFWRHHAFLEYHMYSLMCHTYKSPPSWTSANLSPGQTYTTLVSIFAKKGVFFSIGGANSRNQEKGIILEAWVRVILKKGKILHVFITGVGGGDSAWRFTVWFYLGRQFKADGICTFWLL